MTRGSCLRQNTRNLSVSLGPSGHTIANKKTICRVVLLNETAQTLILQFKLCLLLLKNQPIFSVALDAENTLLVPLPDATQIFVLTFDTHFLLKSDHVGHRFFPDYSCY